MGIYALYEALRGIAVFILVKKVAKYLTPEC
jgi:hypothetical protein